MRHPKAVLTSVPGVGALLALIFATTAGLLGVVPAAATTSCSLPGGASLDQMVLATSNLTIDGSAAPSGTVVEALSSGTVIGCVATTNAGALRLTVNANDGTQGSPYPANGTTFTVKVNGLPAVLPDNSSSPTISNNAVTLAAANPASSFIISSVAAYNAPAPPTPVTAPSYSRSTTSLGTVSWTASVTPTTTGYKYAVGSSSGASDVLGFTDVGNTTSVVTSGLNLVDGHSYYVSVLAYDNNGQQGTPGISNATLVDTSDPTVSVTAPASNAILNNNKPTLSASATDPNSGSGVASVQFQVDGSNVGSPVTSGSGNTYSLTLSNALTDGTHNVTATATDRAGNTSSASAANSFTVDTTAPAVTLTAPAGNTSINASSGALSVSATATDTNGSGVASVKWQTSANNGQTWLDATSPDTTPSSPNTYTSTLTTPADGTYLLRAFATDVAGNSQGSSSVQLTVDTTLPAVSMTAPANGSATRNNKPTLTASATDTDGVASVQFQVDGSNVGAPVTSGNAGSYSLALTNALSEGPHTAAAVATDVAGNTRTSTSVSFSVDTTAPNVSLTAPGSPTTSNNNKPTLTASASDTGSGVASVQFQVDGSNVGSPVTTGNAGSYSLTLTSALSDGQHTIAAVATDQAGNSATSGSQTYTVDTTAPSVSITAPSAGADLNNNLPTFTATATDTNGTGVQSVQFKLDGADFGALQTTPTSPNTYSVTAGAPLADGPHTIAAVATDNAGNTGTATTVNFTVDTTAPSVSISRPTEGQALNSSMPTLTASASDAGSGVASVQFAVDGSNVGNPVTTGNAGNYSLTLTTPLSDGPYTVTATATDRANNTSTPATTVNFSVDTVAPTVSVTSPADGTLTNNGQPTLTASASDTGSGVASVQFKVDGANLGNPVTTGNAGSYTLTAPISDGPHTITAVATDNAGNSATSAGVRLTVDTTAPSATVTEPANGSLTNQNQPTLTVSAADAGSGVASVQFAIDGSNVGSPVITPASGTPASGTYSLALTNALADGSHTVSASVTDNAGNTGTATTITFTVDTTAPSVSVTTPANISDVNSSRPTLTASATDTGSGVASVQFQVDGSNVGSPVTTGNAGSYSLTLTTPLSDGPHGVTATATDRAGNTSSVSSANTFVVDTAAPAVSVTSPADGTLTNNNPLPTFSATATDTGTGVQSVQFRLDGADFGALQTTPTSPNTYSVTAGAPLTQGQHTITAIATDRAGNAATSAGVRLTVDTQAPTVTNNTVNFRSTSQNGQTVVSPTWDPASGHTAVTFSAGATDNLAVDRVTFGLYDLTANQPAIPSGHPGTLGTNGLYSYTAQDLTEGHQYRVQATAFDTAGNSSTTPGQTFVVGPSVPSIDGTVVQNAPLNTTTFTISGSVNPTDNLGNGGSVALYADTNANGALDLPGDTLLVQPAAVVNNAFSFNVTLTRHNAFNYFLVQVADANGVATTVSVAVAEQDTPPPPPVSNPSNGGGSSSGNSGGGSSSGGSSSPSTSNVSSPTVTSTPEPTTVPNTQSATPAQPTQQTPSGPTPTSTPTVVPVPTLVVTPTATTIPSNTGGTVQAANGAVVLDVPAGAANQTLTFQIQPATTPTSDNPNPAPLPPSVPAPSGFFKLGSTVFQINASDASGNQVHQFNPAEPLTISIHPTVADVQAAQANGTTLTLAFFDPATNQWVSVPTTVGADGSLTAQVDHLTLFAIVQKASSFPAVPLAATAIWSNPDPSTAVSFGTIPAGTPLTILSQQGGRYFAADPNGNPLWIDAGQVTQIVPALAGQPESLTGSGPVLVQLAYDSDIYSGSGPDAVDFGTQAAGTAYQVLQLQGPRYFVEGTDGSVGWINSAAVVLATPAPSAPAAPQPAQPSDQSTPDMVSPDTSGVDMGS